MHVQTHQYDMKITSVKMYSWRNYKQIKFREC